MGIEFLSSNKKFRLEWVNLGEGWSGDYDPEDPEDVPLLRADLFMEENGEWVEPADSSYCTLAPVGTPEEKLREVSERLFYRLGDKWRRREMEAWTWETKP